MRPIINTGRLQTSMGDFYPSRCTIATQLYTTNAANQLVPSGEAPIGGLVNISCRLGPLIRERPTDLERRGSDVSSLKTSRQCKLNGYFPQIVANTMVAQVDDISYSIVGVEHDGSRFTTRLRLEIVTP